MLKYILFILSDYYYEKMKERMEEIRSETEPHQVEVVLRKGAGEFSGKKGIEPQETLVIADESEMTRSLLNRGWFVVILYHEKNRQLAFPPVRYGVEDVSGLDYQSYEEAYRRLAGLPWNILETDRLRVRESTLDDVDEFYQIYQEPSITFYMEDLYQEREKERAYMKAYIDQVYGFYGYGLWTVILKKNGQVIGRAGLSIREGYEMPEIGFVIGTQYQRQGYGFEVCSAILRYAGEKLGFDRIQALVKEKNQASRRLLDKMGFIFQKDVMERGDSYRLYIKHLEKESFSV